MSKRFRIEWRDEAGNNGADYVEVEDGPEMQLAAEVKFIKAAQAEGRKLWCTWSGLSPLPAGVTCAAASPLTDAPKEQT